MRTPHVSCVGKGGRCALDPRQSGAFINSTTPRVLGRVKICHRGEIDTTTPSRTPNYDLSFSLSKHLSTWSHRVVNRTGPSFASHQSIIPTAISKPIAEVPTWVRTEPPCGCGCEPGSITKTCAKYRSAARQVDNSKGTYLPGRIRGTKKASFGVESKGHRSEAAVGAFREVRSLSNKFIARCRVAPGHG